MGVKSMASVAVAVAVLLGGALPGAAQEAKRPEAARERFSFYGLRFGMSPEQARAVMPLDAKGTEAVKPGHGMMHLVLVFDFRERLAEIRASWERPAEPLREEGMRRALTERFIQPVSSRFRDVSATIDEYSNRAAFTVVLIALDVREENLNHYKAEYLKLTE